MFRPPWRLYPQLHNVPRQFHRLRNGTAAGSPARVAARCNSEAGKDCRVAWLRGTADSVLASAVTGVVSSPHFPVATPLLTIRCDCALGSFEIAKPFLLLGAKNLVDCGLHASVRDDQSCQQACFCISQSF
jgi:hypothetical protein